MQVAKRKQRKTFVKARKKEKWCWEKPSKNVLFLFYLCVCVGHPSSLCILGLFEAQSRTVSPLVRWSLQMYIYHPSDALLIALLQAIQNCDTVGLIGLWSCNLYPSYNRRIFFGGGQLLWQYTVFNCTGWLSLPTLTSKIHYIDI